METANTKIKFAIYIWRNVYVIKSQFGHYLGLDGLIHDDAGENCQWGTRTDAGDYLLEWNSKHDFRRIEKLSIKNMLSKVHQ